jgi:hypothetical protein
MNRIHAATAAQGFQALSAVVVVVRLVGVCAS